MTPHICDREIALRDNVHSNNDIEILVRALCNPDALNGNIIGKVSLTRYVFDW